MIPSLVRIHVFTAPLVSKAFITHRMGRNSVISKLIRSWETLIGKFGRSSCLELAAFCVVWYDLSRLAIKKNVEGHVFRSG